MSHDSTPAPAAGGCRFLSPWYVLGAGLLCNAAAYVLASSDAGPLLLQEALLAAGIALLVIAVVRRLKTTGWETPQRIESSAMVSLAGLGALVSYGFFRIHQEWDSGIEFSVSLFILALCGSLLILLPPLARRTALSLMLVFHFGGMATAITSIDPPGGTPPYLPKQLWTWVYRPYLTFLYMTNAYHFYSPDPGPPSLLWFAIQYSDGSYTWVKIPDRANSPVGMHYQRVLAMPEHSYQPQPRLPFSLFELKVANAEIPQRGPWETIYARRELGSTFLYRYPNPPRELKEPAPGYPIPMVPPANIDIMSQYREPQDVHKKILAYIARRMLENAPPAPTEGVTAQSVKMYRLIHRILSPQELAEGMSPLDKTKYAPYFMGEFDRNANLKDPLEPFLYWYLPITMVPPDYPRPEVSALDAVAPRPQIPVVYVGLKPKGGFLLDCLEMHAAGRIADRAKEKK
jgi:hypothetical protein